MSFGFAFGDFLAVAKLANDIWQRLHDSVGQFADIRDEVKGYSSLLYSVSKTVSDQYLSPEQAEGLDASARACRSVLEDLQKLVDKYRRLTNEASGLTASVRQKAKRLQWDQDDARDLRARITSTTIVLRGLCETIARDQQARRELCQWLSPLDFPAQQREIYSLHQHGSGQWLLQSERFKGWLESEGGVMLCPGDPGAGKTVLASIVINHLWNEVRTDRIGVAYIYCDYLKHQEQSSIHLVGSLLRQLAEQQNPISGSLKNYYDEHRRSNTNPSPERAFEVFKADCDIWSRIYIIIDALDECSEKDATRQIVVKGLLSLQGSKRINILVTSRPIPSILCNFELWERLEIRADSKDIHRYLLGQMDRFSKRILAEKDLQAKIINGIMDAADGMFLLARLTCHCLVGHKTPKAVKDTLNKLSRGACSLDSAYHGAMKRIEKQDQFSRELAIRTLSWITQGQRLLSVAEIQQAVAIELGDPDLDPDSTVDCDDIISACTGLVTRGHDSRGEILRLIHYTTKEYFERTKTMHFPKAQEYLASACLTYMLFDVFSGALCPPRQDDVRDVDSDTGVRNKAREVFCFGCKRCWTAEKHEAEPKEVNGSWELKSYNKDPCFYLRRKQYPFFEYAVSHWGHHAERCDDEAIQLLTETFLDDTRRVSGMFCYSLYDESFIDDGRSPYYDRFFYDGRSPHDTLRLELQDFNTGSAIQLVAYLGLTKLVSQRLEDGSEPDVEDKCGRTPFLWAVYMGHEDVVKLLMAREDVNPNVRDWTGRTPLMVAVVMEYTVIVELLLACKNVELNAKDGSWALSYAILQKANGLQIVKLLLACDHLDVNAIGMKGMTSLMIAIDCCNVESTRLLLARDDIQVNAMGDKGKTPLHVAARSNSVEAMRLLLAREDIQVNAKDDTGETVLHIAAREPWTENMRLLLAHSDIQVNAMDNRGATALHIASSQDWAEGTRLLLAHKDVQVNLRSDSGVTALHVAVQYGTPIELFLARGDVDLNIKDQYGRTPLYYAICSGESDVVQLLLTREDLEIDIEDGEGGNLISLAEDERDKAEEGMESDAYNAIILLLRSYLERRSSNTTSANLNQQNPQRSEHTKDDNDDDDNDDDTAHGTDDMQVIEEQMLELAVEESPLFYEQ